MFNIKYFINLKTFEKISLSFSFFNLISLIILLLLIIVIYFFIWQSDQKKESLYDINMNYDIKKDKETFINYILKKETKIKTKNNWEIICSSWISAKLNKNKESLEKLNKSWFYKEEDKIYFIFSKKYEWIWEVKLLFDTTPYIKSQIIIIKISLIIIFFSIFIYYYAGKLVGRRFLENLQQFITDVSHEFKTPLMVINSRIDVFEKKIQKWKIQKTDLNDLFKDIKIDINKLNRLLETLFFLSKNEK